MGVGSWTSVGRSVPVAYIGGRQHERRIEAVSLDKVTWRRWTWVNREERRV